MGNILSHACTIIRFLHDGYVGHGYPLPSLGAVHQECAIGMSKRGLKIGPLSSGALCLGVPLLPHIRVAQ
jgi:hypothetical protein